MGWAAYAVIATLIPFANFAAVNAAENVPLGRLLLYSVATATIAALLSLAIRLADRSLKHRGAVTFSAFILLFFSFPIMRSVLGMSSIVLQLVVYAIISILLCSFVWWLTKLDWFRHFWVATLGVLLALSVGRYTIQAAQIDKDHLSAHSDNATWSEYRTLGTAVTPLPVNLDAAKSTDGDGIMRVGLTPRKSHSQLRIHVVANAYSEQNTTAVIALFRDGIQAPVSLQSKPIVAGHRVTFDFAFNVSTSGRTPVVFDVRMGPAARGTILINKPNSLPWFTNVSPVHVSIAELDPGATYVGNNLPNVYYLTLDEYPRIDTLKAVFGFDNTSFMRALQASGFQVSARSFANYMGTFLSVPAAMEQRYVVDESDHNFWKRVRWLQSIINGNNRVFKHFQDLGYFVSKLNFLDECPSDAFVDYCYTKNTTLNPWMSMGVTDFELALVQLTPVFAALQLVKPDFLKKRVIIEDMDDVMRLVRERKERPRFVYSHIWLPHPPYRFKADCQWAKRIDISGSNSSSPQQHFLDQVQCANRKVLEFVSSVVDDDPSAIILINSDHGSGFTVPWSLPYPQWPDAAVNERFGNLNAMRLPTRCRSLFYDTISPVNYFELVFSCIEGRRPHFLEDRIYLSTFDKAHAQYGQVWRYR